MWPLAVGRFAMQAIPYLTAAGAALPALKEGKPLEAAIQGGLGYLTGGAVKGGIGALTRSGIKSAPGAAGLLQKGIGQVAPNVVDSPLLGASAIGRFARVGIPVAGAILAPKIGNVIGGGAAQAAPNVAQAGQLPLQYGAGYLGTRPYDTDYGAGMPSYDPNLINQIQQAVYGSNPLDVIGPKGMARTAETIRQAAADAEAMKRTGDVEQKFLNVMKQKDLERNIVAAAARGNIATQLGMLSQAQTGAQDIAARAMTGLSQGLAQQYQYQ